jgi:hypothetical protein
MGTQAVSARFNRRWAGAETMLDLSLFRETKPLVAPPRCLLAAGSRGFDHPHYGRPTRKISSPNTAKTSPRKEASQYFLS